MSILFFQLTSSRKKKQVKIFLDYCNLLHWCSIFWIVSPSKLIIMFFLIISIQNNIFSHMKCFHLTLISCNCIASQWPSLLKIQVLSSTSSAFRLSGNTNRVQFKIQHYIWNTKSLHLFHLATDYCCTIHFMKNQIISHCPTACGSLKLRKYALKDMRFLNGSLSIYANNVK